MRIFSIHVISGLLVAFAQPAVVRAAVATEAAVSREDVDALKLVKLHFGRGEAKYRDRRYAESVHEYMESLAALPAGISYDSYRARILWSLIGGRRALAEQEHPGAPPCAAETDLQALQALARPLPQDLEAKRPEMDALARTLVERCHVVVVPPVTTPAEPSPVGTEPMVPSDPKPEEPPEPEKGGGQPPQSVDPDRKPPPPAGRGLMIGGGALAGLGLAALAGMAASLVLGEQAQKQLRASMTGDERLATDHAGRHANTAAVATGVFGGVATVTGVVMLALGQRRTKTARLSVIPSLRPGAAALSLRFVF